MTRQICANFFFAGFRRKHVYITTCIEKHCTWPFKFFLCWYCP